MENIEEIEKKSEVINSFLDMIAETPNAPLDFKILSENRKADNLFREINLNKNFMKLEDDSEEKQALYSFKKQRIQFYKELKERID